MNASQMPIAFISSTRKAPRFFCLAEEGQVGEVSSDWVSKATDTVALGEDVLAHLGVPSSGGMSEMDACFKQLLDRNN